MLNSLASMFDTLGDPPRLHAAAVHLPIAFALFGLVLTIALAATRGKSCLLRWLTVGVFVAGVGVSFWVANTGEGAEHHIGDIGVQMTAEAMQEFDEHEEMADKVWLFMAAGAALTALSAVKKPAVRAAAMALAIIAGVANLGWVAATAHHGGNLVYLHGVGVPASENNYPAATQPK